MSDRRWILSGLLLLTVAACELIVDFDEEGQGDDDPTPIDQQDGSMPVLVDASAIADGSVIRPPRDGGRDGAADAGDASVRQDASLDAAQDASVDAAADASPGQEEDAGDIDAAVDAGEDASLDAGSGLDGSSIDAAAVDAAAGDAEPLPGDASDDAAVDAS